MLRVSKLADYGTVLMVYLAAHEGELLSAREIAAGTFLQLPTVSKCLKLLASSGLLTSKQGAQGGYCLARPADCISVAELIVAIEGQQGLTECADDAGSCSLEAVCAMSENWRVISSAIHAALESVKLSDLRRGRERVCEVDTSAIIQMTEGV